MKRRWAIVLGCGALGGLAGGLGRLLPPDELWAALSAPLQALGRGLRALSLSGFWGNAAAWAVVLLLCAAPVLAAMGQRRWRRGPEDWLLVLEAPVLYAAMLYLVNPSRLDKAVSAFFPVAAAGTVLAVAVCWLALKWLARLEERDTAGLACTFRRLLILCAGAWAFGTGLGQASALGAEIDQVVQNNTGAVGSTLAVLVLLSVLELAAGLLAPITLLWGAELVGRMGEDTFTQETVELCGRTAQSCKWVAQATVLLAVFADLLQLALIGQLHTTHFSVSLPLVSLALSAGLYLLCRCLQRGQVLQADSDSII